MAYGYCAINFLGSRGISFDEHLEAQGMVEQIRQAFSLWNGREANYRDVVENLEYYGFINKLPALLMWLAVHQAQWPELIAGSDSFSFVTLMERSGYYDFAHLVSIFAFLATVWLVVLISRRLHLRHWLVPGLLCLWWPALVGHSFMNIKDMPFAWAYSAYTYSAVCSLQRAPRFTWQASVGLRGAFAGLMMAIKVPAVIPLLISELVIQSLCVRDPQAAATSTGMGDATSVGAESRAWRGLRGSVYRVSAFLGCCWLVFFVVTPSSWGHPAAFIGEAYALHTNHAWGGCTWLGGVCEGKAVNPSQWNTGLYILRWFFVQTPGVVLLLLALSGAELLLRLKQYGWRFMRGLAAMIQAAPLLVPILLQALLLPALAVINNSALYGALRHLSFALPPVAILAVAGAEAFWRRSRRRAMITLVLILLLGGLLVDSLLITPFQYVYRNEVGRMMLNRTHSELDYWGTSSGELMAAVAAREPDTFGLVNGYRPMISVYHNLLGRRDVPGGPRFRAEFSVDDLMRPIHGCRSLAEVRRSLIATPDLLLSRAYACP